MNTKLVFGIYPGGAAGSDNGIVKGKPDNPELIMDALSELHPAHSLFLVRAYLHYVGSRDYKNLTPLDPIGYLHQRAFRSSRTLLQDPEPQRLCHLSLFWRRLRSDPFQPNRRR